MVTERARRCTRLQAGHSEVAACRRGFTGCDAWGCRLDARLGEPTRAPYAAAARVAASSTLELQARPGRVARAPPPKIWRCPRPLLRRHPRRASRPSLEPGVRVATGLIDRVCIAATVDRAALSLRAACSYLTPVSPADTVVAARRHHRYHRCLIERLQLVLDLGGVIVIRVHYRAGRSVS